MILSVPTPSGLAAAPGGAAPGGAAPRRKGKIVISTGYGNSSQEMREVILFAPRRGKRVGLSRKCLIRSCFFEDVKMVTSAQLHIR